MARRSPEGESRLDFVEDIQDPTAPTAAELNAGVPIAPHAAEWDFPESGQTIDTADMGSAFNKQDAGTYGGDSATVTVYRDDDPGADEAWAALTRHTRGYFVERLFGGTGEDYDTGDTVTVYEGVVISRAVQSRTRNTPLQAQVTVAITAEPEHDVEVAGA